MRSRLFQNGKTTLARIAMTGLLAVGETRYLAGSPIAPEQGSTGSGQRTTAPTPVSPVASTTPAYNTVINAPVFSGPNLIQGMPVSAYESTVAGDYLKKGDMALDAKDYEGAIQAYTKAIQLNPGASLLMSDADGSMAAKEIPGWLSEMPHVPLPSVRIARPPTN
jgi:tetratricopeptide (TPR) repeat protein